MIYYINKIKIKQNSIFILKYFYHLCFNKKKARCDKHLTFITTMEKNPKIHTVFYKLIM
ncbi:hypothetical protein AcetOrient_orf02443 [Acetobacter orientalis]|uniref:Uncharacterized protein n=1 Tax=Acetobacter orientalis TaxID=146474 RepID=A0A2Z5ZHG2_9PROT|nr:hypothetical protein AcetOrient_orf02443 [Acetobacter orientalis]